MHVPFFPVLLAVFGALFFFFFLRNSTLRQGHAAPATVDMDALKARIY